MPAGLYVLNDDDITQIDSTYRNLHLMRKGSVSFNTASMPVASVTGLKATEVLVVRSTRPIRLATRTMSGGLRTESYGANGGSGNLEYWVFDTPIPGSSDYGLQVFNASSTLVFDSGFPPMTVAANFDGYTGAFPPSAPKVTNLPAAGARYGVILLGSGIDRTSRYEGDFSYQVIVNEDFVTTTTSSIINTGKYSSFYNSGPAIEVLAGASRGVAVDLTNL